MRRFVPGAAEGPVMAGVNRQHCYVVPLLINVDSDWAWVAKCWFETYKEACDYAEKAIEITHVTNAIVYLYLQERQEVFVEAIYGDGWDDEGMRSHRWANQQVLIVLRTAIKEGLVAPNFAYVSGNIREFLGYKTPFDWDSGDYIPREKR